MMLAAEPSLRDSDDPSRVTSIRTVGLIQIGAARVALPVDSIREVVRGQPRYGVLPIKAEGLLGGIDVRGTILPVLDLRPILGWVADEDDAHVVVIMRCEGYLVGLRAEAVSGILQIQPGALCELTAVGSGPSALLATHAFESGDGIVTILDPSRIADRPGLPKVREKTERRDVATIRTASETVLLFSHGQSYLGIDADCVDAAMPDVSIQKSAMTTGFCLGAIEHRGYNVPVVDTMAAVGLGAGPRPATCTVIFIRFGAKTMLGLAVDTVRDIVPVAPDALIAMPAVRHEGLSLFRGMLLGPDEPHHILLDLDQLRRHPELVELAHLCRPQPRLQVGEATGATRTAGHGQAERFITYLAGGEFASRLGQITEVLPFPDHVVPFTGVDVGVLGLFVHRRRLMPLIALGRALMNRDQAIDEATARVLFVEVGDRCAGFVVETLVSIDNADPDQWAAAKDGGRASLMGFPFVMLGDERRMVSHVDLAAQIDRAYNPPILEGATDEAEDIVPLQASA